MGVRPVQTYCKKKVWTSHLPSPTYNVIICQLFFAHIGITPWLSQRVLLLLIFPPWHSMNNWEGSCWQDVYTFLRHKIWILSQIHWSWVCGNFSHHCVWDRVITNGGKNSHSSTKKIPTAQQRKFPQLQFCFSESGTKSRSWDSFYPPTQHKAQHQWSHQCIHCMHILIRVEKNCIFWSELGNFTFLVWEEILFVFGVRVGKMSYFKQSWKILPSRDGKIMITEKKIKFSNFFQLRL